MAVLPLGRFSTKKTWLLAIKIILPFLLFAISGRVALKIRIYFGSTRQVTLTKQLSNFNVCLPNSGYTGLQLI